MSGGAFYLGIDVGTQSLTALLIEVSPAGGDGDDRARGIVARARVHYDTELPAYGTVNGQLPNDDPAIGRVPPCMWLDALDLALHRLGPEACQAIRGVSVSGQQHGSVYLAAGANRGRSLPWCRTGASLSKSSRCSHVPKRPSGPTPQPHRNARRSGTHSAAPQRQRN